MRRIKLLLAFVVHAGCLIAERSVSSTTTTTTASTFVTSPALRSSAQAIDADDHLQRMAPTQKPNNSNNK